MVSALDRVNGERLSRWRCQICHTVGAVQVNNSKGLIESLNIAWLRELLNSAFEDKFRTSGCGCGVSASTCELERSGSSVVSSEPLDSAIVRQDKNRRFPDSLTGNDPSYSTGCFNMQLVWTKIVCFQLQ